MPPNPFVDPLPALRRIALWAVLVGLVIGLPLQAASSALAGLLGPRHVHPTAPSHDRSGDPMAGWRDFRRANYEHADVDAQAHAHAHAAGLRHHHAPDDAGVVDLEAPADGDGAPAGSPHPAAAFVTAASVGRLEPVARPAAAGDAAWRPAAERPLPAPSPGRIERPPRRT